MEREEQLQEQLGTTYTVKVYKGGVAGSLVAGRPVNGCWRRIGMGRGGSGGRWACDARTIGTVVLLLWLVLSKPKRGPPAQLPAEHLKSKDLPEPAVIAGLQSPSDQAIARFNRQQEQLQSQQQHQHRKSQPGGGAHLGVNAAGGGAAAAHSKQLVGSRPWGSPPQGHNPRRQLYNQATGKLFTEKEAPVASTSTAHDAGAASAPLPSARGHHQHGATAKTGTQSVRTSITGHGHGGPGGAPGGSHGAPDSSGAAGAGPAGSSGSTAGPPEPPPVLKAAMPPTLSRALFR